MSSELENSRSFLIEKTDNNLRHKDGKKCRRTETRAKVKAKSSQESTKESVCNSRKLNAFSWWRRLNYPSKKVMKRKCRRGEMKDVDLVPGDVDLLPWLDEEMHVDVPQMMEWMAKVESPPPSSRQKQFAGDKNSRRRKLCSKKSSQSCQPTKSDMLESTESTTECDDIDHDFVFTSTEWEDAFGSRWEMDRATAMPHEDQRISRLAEEDGDTVESSSTFRSRTYPRSNSKNDRGWSKTREKEEEEEWKRISYQNSRKLNAYNWWSRLGYPSKTVMLRRCGRGEMEKIDLTPNDVMLLPWLEGGLVVDEGKWMAELQLLSTPIKKHETKDIRNNSPMEHVVEQKHSNHGKSLKTRTTPLRKSESVRNIISKPNTGEGMELASQSMHGVGFDRSPDRTQSSFAHRHRSPRERIKRDSRSMHERRQMNSLNSSNHEQIKGTCAVVSPRERAKKNSYMTNSAAHSSRRIYNGEKRSVALDADTVDFLQQGLVEFLRTSHS